MLKQIKLTYFGKHEDLTVDFGSGLNAIRASNESGKSTVLKAVVYALFGSSVLPETLADTVTYGHKESELKVELDYSHAGVEYLVKRSKAGAEVTFGSQRITGQTETKRFNEQLFGAPSDVISKLMVANQSNIRGALDNGPKGTTELIEALANFDLIDVLTELVQTKLPYGNASMLEQQVRALTEQLAIEPEDRSAGLLLEVGEAKSDLAAAEAHFSSLPTADVAAAVALLEEAKSAVRYLGSLLTEKATLEAAVEAALPENGDESKIASAKQDLLQLQELGQAVRLLKEYLKRLPAEYYPGNFEALEAEIAGNGNVVNSAKSAIAEISVKLATLSAQVISETVCPLCDKDLTAVPEVLSKNAALQAQIAALKEAKVEAHSRLEVGKAKEAPLSAWVNLSQTHSRFLQECGKYVTVDYSTVPPSSTWIGPTGGEEVVPDYAAEIRKEESKIKAYNLAMAQKEAAKLKLGKVQDELSKLSAASEADVALLEFGVQAASKHTEDRHTAAMAVQQSFNNLSNAERELANHAAHLKKHADEKAKAEAQLEALKSTVKEMELNTVLAKKLRGVKPKVASQLWGIVLASVSSYFSRIRGIPSTVSITDGVFYTDGHPITGLSGSTKDALGLAIRMALTRTFLPNSEFLILDEAAAGMDDTREAALLGLVATCGFEQVIFVTHSELADSFADQVITL